MIYSIFRKIHMIFKKFIFITNHFHTHLLFKIFFLKLLKIKILTEPEYGISVLRLVPFRSVRPLGQDLENFAETRHGTRPITQVPFGPSGQLQMRNFFFLLKRLFWKIFVIEFWFSKNAKPFAIDDSMIRLVRLRADPGPTIWHDYSRVQDYVRGKRSRLISCLICTHCELLASCSLPGDTLILKIRYNIGFRSKWCDLYKGGCREIGTSASD